MNLHAALSIPYRLDNWDGLSDLIAIWRQVAPTLLPHRAGPDEPVREKFDTENLAAALPAWLEKTWIARRSRPSMYASLLTGFLHTTLNVHVEDGPLYLNELSRLASELGHAFGADFGMVHRLTESELEEARSVHRPDLMTVNSRTGYAVLSTGFTRGLEKGLPTLYWRTILGPSYVSLFDERTVLSTPASSVERHGDSVTIQLTPEPPTNKTWREFRTGRDAAIEHLGRNAFYPNASRIASSMTTFQPPPWRTIPRVG